MTNREMMEFPKTFDEFAREYGFYDKEEVYTNGRHLISVFRVNQWLEHVKQLEQQPCYNTDEWCHDCKEYDHDKHCCPRYNKVIRSAVEEIKQAKVGHWISYWDEEARCYVYKCPECGNKQPFDTKCCWECGTRLIEPQESEES